MNQEKLHILPNIPNIPNNNNSDNDDDEEKGTGICNNKFCWWIPNQKSLSVTFCNETSIHGFKFLGQEKRHMSERIFWAIGFLSSLGLAIYLIYGVWERYERVPVIVSFQASEQDMDTIPFPAVTLCNMNKFPASKVIELEKIANDPTNSKYNLAKKQLLFVRNACNAQQSFAKDFDFAYNRGTRRKLPKKTSYYPYSKKTTNPEANTNSNTNETELTEEDQKAMTDFLLDNTISCSELVRLCMLGEQVLKCEDLFKPLITDYGKCCVFNILPLPLLLRNAIDPNAPNENPVLGTKAEQNWPADLVKNWSAWNYEDGFVLDRNMEYPWRQKRAGLPYGLSLLLDPNVGDYYCPASDSLGVRYILHTPLEMPHVMEFSSVADLEKEILIEVHPDVTNAADDIRSIAPEKRLCYFGTEKSLEYFRPYTGGNCVDECSTKALYRTCNCTLFYMPRDAGVRICDSDPSSKDFTCIEEASRELQKRLKEDCGHCVTLCEDIAYNYETTIADLQNFKTLWGDPNPKIGPAPSWANHQMSVVHIFFGAETTVPKFRKRLYGTTDLIANTGGILGLCLGFSILSGVEVLYFITLRAFWKFCRKRALKSQTQKQQQDNKTNSYLHQLLFQRQVDKVINLNPNAIPVYPREMIGQGMWPPTPNRNVTNGWVNSQGHHFYGANSFINPNNQSLYY